MSSVVTSSRAFTSARVGSGLCPPPSPVCEAPPSPVCEAPPARLPVLSEPLPVVPVLRVSCCQSSSSDGHCPEAPGQASSVSCRPLKVTFDLMEGSSVSLFLISSHLS